MRTLTKQNSKTEITNIPICEQAVSEQASSRLDSADLTSWSPHEVTALWKKSYETCRNCFESTKSDEQVVSGLTYFLSDSNVSADEKLRLLQHWVEMVLSYTYRSAFAENASSKHYTEVLYACLNDAFMPGEDQVLSLANRASVQSDTAAQFLHAFKLWIGQQTQGCPMESLGWILRKKGGPGLVLCWDEVIPQTRYLKYWSQSQGAEILERDDNLLFLLLDASSNNVSRNVRYNIQGLEAEGLEEGDRVRYWQNYEGRPFVFAEKALSPYVDQHIAEWTGIDDRVYDSDPLPVG